LDSSEVLVVLMEFGAERNEEDGNCWQHAYAMRERLEVLGLGQNVR